MSLHLVGQKTRFRPMGHGDEIIAPLMTERALSMLRYIDNVPAMASGSKCKLEFFTCTRTTMTLWGRAIPATKGPRLGARARDRFKAVADKPRGICLVGHREVRVELAGRITNAYCYLALTKGSAGLGSPPRKLTLKDSTWSAARFHRSYSSTWLMSGDSEPNTNRKSPDRSRANVGNANIVMRQTNPSWAVQST
jgi:hypothetical protein